MRDPDTPANEEAPAAIPECGPDNPLGIGAPGGPPEVLLPLSLLRQTTVRHMQETVTTMAPVTVFAEVDMSAAAACRERMRSEVEARAGVPLTYMPLFIQATVTGLKACPILNAVLTEDGHRVPRTVHLGMATAVVGGVLMPILRHAETKSLTELAAEVHRLTEAARWGQMGPADQTDPTFCITNQGRWGTTVFGTPTIRHPNAGILAFETVRRRPVVLGDDIVARPMMYLSLTFDHRAADGSDAAQFIGVVKDYLEGL